MRIRGLALVALAGLTAAAYWSCGGDSGNGANFSGEVSTVTASLPLREPQNRRLTFALPEFPSRAHAQAGSCVAPGARALLIFCIRTSAFEVCQPVDPATCTFSLNAVLDGGPSTLVMTFVDDTNASVERDAGEPVSTVQQSLVYCNEDQIEITNATVNFTSGTTTASVTKKVDRCRNVTATPTRGTPLPTVTGTPPTPTPTRTGTPATATPTRTGTPATATPTRTATASYGASLNQSPSSMLAFLFSAGAVGLLLPRRRRRDRRE